MASIEDFAKICHERLNALSDYDPTQTRCPPPTILQLTEIFRVVFYASLKTEEGRPIQVRLYYIDPNNPDPNPPRRVRINRWRTFRFGTPLSSNVPNLVKLAKAADAWATGIAIHSDPKDGLIIWGLVDQVLHFSTAIVRENKKGLYSQPGAFHVAVNGPADITAMSGFALLARLSQEKLVLKENACLDRGPVSGLIDSWIESICERVQQDSDVYADFVDSDYCRKITHDYWVSTISRILIHIQRQRHGGALLICPDWPNEQLRAKFELPYDRLTQGIISYIRSSLSIRAELARDEEGIPRGRRRAFQRYSFLSAQADRDDAEHMMSAAIRFVSSLAGVDGLVVMSPDLRVHSFATLIATQSETHEFDLTSDPEISESFTTPINSLGTRHGSMIRFCSENPDSLGFVVSQDGDIRAVTEVDGKCFLFDAMRVHDTWFQSRKDEQGRRFVLPQIK